MIDFTKSPTDTFDGLTHPRDRHTSKGQTHIQGTDTHPRDRHISLSSFSPRKFLFSQMRLPGEGKPSVSKAEIVCQEAGLSGAQRHQGPTGMCDVSPTSPQAMSVAQKWNLPLGVREALAARTRPDGRGPTSEQSAA